MSEVKGFIALPESRAAPCVSREGSLVSRALLAGIVGGFGAAFPATPTHFYRPVGANGQREALSPTDILAGGRPGCGEAADTVSRYLIERAEQYQPVVEMPTGIEVEIALFSTASTSGAPPT